VTGDGFSLFSRPNFRGHPGDGSTYPRHPVLPGDGRRGDRTLALRASECAAARCVQLLGKAATSCRSPIPEAVLRPVDVPIQFDATPRPTRTGIVSYTWTFGRGHRHGPTPTHTLHPTNSYEVALEVTDDGGLGERGDGGAWRRDGGVSLIPWLVPSPMIHPGFGCCLTR